MNVTEIWVSLVPFGCWPVERRFSQIGKDPDVRLEKVFVIGKTMPVEIAKSQDKVTVPYNKQHKYFFLSKYLISIILTMFIE